MTNGTPCGAECSTCALGIHKQKEDTFSPVLCETHDGDSILIIGEAPGGHEVVAGRPFVGPSGHELQDALSLAGIERTDCKLTNVIACQPPENKLDNFCMRTQRKLRTKEGKKSGIQLPQAACRGRLDKDIEGFTQVICLGATAGAAMRGGNPSIMGLRGACEVLDKPWGKVKVAYTLHPSFVLRSPKWRRTFQHDIARARRFFRDKLSWKDPEFFFPTTVQEVVDGFHKLTEMGELVAYDVETDAKDPLNAQLRCIGFANTSFSMIVPFLSIDGKTRFFGPFDESIVKPLTAQHLADPPFPLVGHNAGQYDRLVCEQFFGITPKLSADTILLHLLADNEMPHNLGFVGSLYTDFTESWKSDHTAVNARTDEELHTYCAKDCAVTAAVSKPLAREVRDHKQFHLVEREHLLQEVGCSMQRMGMKVDLARLAEHESSFREKLNRSMKVCLSIAPEGFNPNSSHQVRKFLFGEWGLPPVKYNEKSGDPSTDDETLRKVYTKYDLDEEKREFVRSIRLIRRYTKLISTYVKPLRNLMDSRGRIHPSYNRLPATGRYSSSSPNAQNIPGFLRDIFVPEEGHVFVGADADQLELRYIAEEAGSSRLIDVINGGLDPHNETMEIVYGPGIWSLDGAPEERAKKGKGTFKSTRGVTKNVRYAWQYAASVPTIHEQVTSVEDENGELIYANLTHQDIRDVVYGLKRADPQIPKWWDEIRNNYRKYGFVHDTLWGRRRYFRDEEKINELVNHPIQAGGASIIHEAMLELVFKRAGIGSSSLFDGENIPFDFEAGTGLINQCHDSLLFEVPEDEGEEVAKQLQAAMTRRRRHGDKLTYTAEAEVGMNWLEV